ncbi:unnamed protein product [Cuscuta epithymum]|uniref:TF-B3 domain-containing protein n=1 Tax=Cuscuta epithymum TaxID=186058 RepID=A0AAV0D339_9ASTE|nr:unnamed protein product [Cuscuta epithymum]
MEISEVSGALAAQDSSADRFSFMAMAGFGSGSINNHRDYNFNYINIGDDNATNPLLHQFGNSCSSSPPVDHHLTHPHLAAPSSVNAHQLRKRMRSRRRRRSSLNFSPLLLHCHSAFHLPRVSPPLYPTPPALDSSRYRFLFDKELKNSDVGPLRRIVIPKKPAEDYLPKLLIKEGFPISMEDMDGLHAWNFKFRYWPNNSSRMYVLENTGGFVHEHSLGQGDFIAFYMDEHKQNYVIEARKCGDQEAYNRAACVLKDEYGQNGESGGAIQNEVAESEAADYKSSSSCYYPQSFPRVDEESTEQTSTFVYETSFSSEVVSPFDFLGGSMTMMNNYSSFDPLSSFGSIDDSLYIDDFYSAAATDK